MYREYSVSNELYSNIVKKLSAANRKIYRLKKQLAQLKDSEVVASGVVNDGEPDLYVGDYNSADIVAKILDYNGQEIIISIRKGK